jgi:hypothetical protein
MRARTCAAGELSGSPRASAASATWYQTDGGDPGQACQPALLAPLTGACHDEQPRAPGRARRLESEGQSASGRARIQPALTRPLGRVFLAGDYLLFAEMEAAATTGLETAQAVRERLGTV